MKDDLTPFPGPPRESLLQVREALVALHRTLLDSERGQYEAVFGSIPSTQHFLSLVLNDSWFSWLRPLSSLVVQMDEALDEKEISISSVILQDYLNVTRNLLKSSSSEESSFGRQYLEALQRDPDVILSHATVIRLVGADPGSKK